MINILLLSLLVSVCVGYYLIRCKSAKHSSFVLRTPLLVSLIVAVVALIGLSLATNNQPSHQPQAAKQSDVTKVKKLSTKEKKAVLATSSSLKKELTQKQAEAKKLTKKLTKKQKAYKKQVKIASESTSIAQAQAASESQAAASSAAQSQSIAAAAQVSQQAAESARVQSQQAVAAQQAAAAQQSQAAATEQTQNTVYIAPDSGRKYHNDPNCRGLSRANSVIPMSLADAQAQGYTLCGWED